MYLTFGNPLYPPSPHTHTHTHARTRTCAHTHTRTHTHTHTHMHTRTHMHTHAHMHMHTHAHTHTHTHAHAHTHTHFPPHTLLLKHSCQKSQRSSMNNAGQWAVFARLSVATRRGASKIEKNKTSSQLFWPHNSVLATHGQPTLNVALPYCMFSIEEVMFRNL